MTPKNQTEPDPQTPAMPYEPSPLSRAVLYADDPRGDLLRCGRDAQHRVIASSRRPVKAKTAAVGDKPSTP